MSHTMYVKALNIFPLKSGRGISLTQSPVGAEGLPGDRNIMLIDPTGHFITQRELPQIAMISAIPDTGGFRLHMDGKGEIFARPSSSRIEATVWKSVVDAALAESNVNDTLSEWLGQSVMLVFFDARSRRSASHEWTGNETPVTFADGYQILVTTTASLAALNADMAAHGEDSVGMERFRSNIVLESDEPWAEDRWASIEINGIGFDLVKPCARCIMTTQDQRTGSREGPSPMKAMGRLRISADRRVPGVLFGWNATPRSEGLISVGDAVTVLKERREGWALKIRS